ncbi:phosphoribosyl-ATP pyrophosphatase /phosphoribosyl-AMP cyclohydrolase [Eubacterium ruminantium]|jgi:phosphoribosyl-ATP pyrophosphohydrolase/phosphoribosyl-AMP cyclohydrolase|uniref:Histidine biosynthesis bifunctional protein HisIE n=2 Tax=Eubacterium ruminantium TaxID=42322 RepID=A0A1T4LZJ4_9FIRM|nr:MULTISPECIES: bifunctional phosphoribosyl-AMP cyclohydrolase/phosphoribosyl-ATP diphosphatase HisIE [Eubacterium]MCR5367404.1 bifunctional phosphoribosyl-AMP cyclohydrolase/phosphoribosyl-ATP diphosphatase HisIE [Eubacterium sp.]SCW38192.1 phosphoribosyl-ATP pyrophosphatase /phosphoribosyl-AMP cyclohydrolase [Eubacterium ruminantium]SDM45090.1 phosphoribosyl-ATP pyrophosphatase /phosphoribosyl-AMP cyclohydrolase [Eubacterium ruminantium]SJZ60067.1 phosphoribosyl-ATP pyrophosphatase /phosphor
MDYRKIIPCVTMENPIEEAKFYNDSGADEVAFFDSAASRESLDKNIPIIKEITRNIDIPLIACGGVRRLEDVKKLLYAGASKVCMKSAPMQDISIVTEASERFGSERIIVTIDLTEDIDPVKYAKEVKQAGAGNFLILHHNKVDNYEEIVAKIRKEAPLPTVVSSYSTDGDEIAEMLSNTNAEAISLYNLAQHDVMQIKQACKKKNVYVNLFESSKKFSEFKTDANGLVPCIAQDYKTGEVLMLAYMNEESYNKTIETGRMTYYSRSRNELWTKGDTSGHYQFVKSLTIDCDNDTILAKVSQVGAACHTGNRSCFFTPLVSKEYNDTNPLTVFSDVYNIIMDRKKNPKEGSYTNYLFDKGIDKILKKVGEECTEVVIAAKNPDPEEMKYEISDLLYHLMVLMADRGTTWEDITKELAERR